MERWTDLAAHWGIETGYFDVQGRRQDADEDTLRCLVEALSGPGNPPAAGPKPPQQPRLAFQGDGGRNWLLAVQLYAVRSRRNWGHGDFTDLAALLDLVADMGGAGIGLNPLHALFYDRSTLGSPYAPNSRLFLNPLYIDVTAVDEFSPEQVSSQAAEIERLRAAELIDYPAIAKLKLAALQAAYAAFVAGGSEQRRRDFEAYREQRGRALECFAAFETLRGQLSGPWWEWPEEWRRPNERATHELRERLRETGFHEYLQWNAERQLEHCRDVARRRGLAVGLYLDTAIGVDASGADAWMDQAAMLRGLSIGAPPDQFNPTGQDWGLTAYNPHGLAAADFEPFRQMLRAAMRHAGAIRIDHVLGLMRLFVIPHGMPAQRGAYLRMAFQSMLSVVAEESNRWRCIVIGEDLGTVPENFRATLQSWGVWSYLVMLFERNWDGSFRRPEEYPDMAIATFNTHDLPTFSGWMSRHDLAMKRGIGVDPGETDDERHKSSAALASAIAGDGRAPTFEDVVAYLAATPTRLVSIGIDDVLELKDQTNVPGTVEQHPNWRRRLPVAVDELAADQRLRRVADILARAGRGSISES